MCGIVAVFNYKTNQPAVLSEILLARERMYSRGPDGAGYWRSSSGRVALAHRRLAILDVSTSGTQPMVSANNSLAISYNGEVYNYRALREELKNSGVRFRSETDTEVLLALYARDGVEMLQKLRGMYAFAIWDQRKRALFLARDAFGIKPLYYADTGTSFYAASQVKALLAFRSIDTATDCAGHAGFFLWGVVPDPHTLYKGIKALPAGSYIWVQEGCRPRQATHTSTDDLFIRPDTLKENSRAGQLPPLKQLNEAINESVSQHLIADVPVGVFLSAGIDSSVIATAASSQTKNLKTVSLGFEEFRETDLDETIIASRVAKILGTEHRNIWITRSDFQSHRERIVQAMDQPSIDGVNTYFVSWAAREAGLKVALSGLGGDEWFGGYPGFRQIPRLVCSLSKLRTPELVARGIRLITSPWIGLFTSPKYAGLLEYGSSFGGAYLLRRGLFMPWELQHLMPPEMAHEGLDKLGVVVSLERVCKPIQDPRVKVSAMEASFYMRNQLLRDSDWAGMANSLEIRVPLVDIKFLNRIIPLISGQDPLRKQHLAKAVTPPLLNELLARRKTGFQIPVREWLTTAESVPVHKTSLCGERGLRRWALHIYGNFVKN